MPTIFFSIDRASTSGITPYVGRTVFEHFTYFPFLLAFGALSLAPMGCSRHVNSEIADSRAFLIEARKAIGSDDLVKALDALDASIENKPTSWAYLERARINAKSGNDQAVLADCKAVLELDPENRDVPWLRKQLKKPVDKRFKGRFETPPSYFK